LIKTATQRSRELFDVGYYCAESVLLAIAESQGIESNLIPRIATGFCSGMARSGGMCGAVSGAIMGIGLVTGRDSPESSVQPSYELVQQLIHRFSQQHGSTLCPELIGCELNSEEGQREFMEKHLVERCQRYVEDATTIAVALLKEKD
jgi:C_GCAxxG_C_C family probable redox protein